MAIKKFLTSVADVYAYDSSDNILFTGKTLLDSSIEVSLGSAPVRGGRGNQLQYIYYHTGEMKFTLTDTQWNLAMLSENVGTDLELGKYYATETVTLSATGSGTVIGTPLAFTGATIYGWATSPTGKVQRITFTGKTFTTTTTEVSQNWCIRYYADNTTSGQSLTIPANIIPSVVKLVMETQLNSSDTSTNKIGVVQIIVPQVALSGAFTLSMKSDGVANTPLTGTALSYTDTDTSAVDMCSSVPYYAKIVEIIDSTNWYDNVYDLSISGGNFTAASGTSRTLVVYAITNSGNSFKAPNSRLTFTSSCPVRVSVGANTGVVTALVASSSATITTIVTAASTLDATCVVTVS